MSKKILKAAEVFCDEHGLRFTDTRRLVLEIVAGARKPITAYEILDQLEGDDKNPNPPIVYGATDFWQSHGFVHQIESLNALVACSEGHQHRGSQFISCDQCGFATEIHMCHLPDSIQKAASDVQFVINFWNLELNGQCRDCS